MSGIAAWLQRQRTLNDCTPSPPVIDIGSPPAFRTPPPRDDNTQVTYRDCVWMHTYAELGMSPDTIINHTH